MSFDSRMRAQAQLEVSRLLIIEAKKLRRKPHGSADASTGPTVLSTKAVLQHRISVLCSELIESLCATQTGQPAARSAGPSLARKRRRAKSSTENNHEASNNIPVESKEDVIKPIKAELPPISDCEEEKTILDEVVIPPPPPPPAPPLCQVLSSYGKPKSDEPTPLRPLSSVPKRSATRVKLPTRRTPPTVKRRRCDTFRAASDTKQNMHMELVRTQKALLRKTDITRTPGGTPTEPSPGDGADTFVQALRKKFHRVVRSPGQSTVASEWADDDWM